MKNVENAQPRCLRCSRFYISMISRPRSRERNQPAELNGCSRNCSACPSEEWRRLSELCGASARVPSHAAALGEVVCGLMAVTPRFVDSDGLEQLVQAEERQIAHSLMSLDQGRAGPGTDRAFPHRDQDPRSLARYRQRSRSVYRRPAKMIPCA